MPNTLPQSPQKHPKSSEKDPKSSMKHPEKSLEVPQKSLEGHLIVFQWVHEYYYDVIVVQSVTMSPGSCATQEVVVRLSTDWYLIIVNHSHYN